MTSKKNTQTETGIVIILGLVSIVLGLAFIFAAIQSDKNLVLFNDSAAQVEDLQAELESTKAKLQLAESANIDGYKDDFELLLTVYDRTLDHCTDLEKRNEFLTTIIRNLIFR